MSNPEVKLENVRPRPVYLDKLSGLSPHSGTAIYPYVYVSRALYDNLISGNPDPSSVALVLHEQEHIERIRNTGALKWYSRYLFSPKFRLHEEQLTWNTEQRSYPAQCIYGPPATMMP
jgi:hypothetical protein